MTSLESHAPTIATNPYPQYEVWRDAGPISYNAEWNSWTVVGHPEVAALLRHPALRADRAQVFFEHLPNDFRRSVEPLSRIQSAMMLFADPPRHTRLRGLVNRAFTPRVVEHITGRVQHTVDILLDHQAASTSLDVIEDLALPLPVMVIAELLGVPSEDWRQLKAWSDDFAMFIGGGSLAPDIIARANESIVAAQGYFQHVLDERRAAPTDDLLSRLIEASDRGDVLDDDELFATAMLVLFAGHETTTNLIGNGMLALLNHPEAMSELHERPELMLGAIEEVLRFDSPVQVTSRLVGTEFEVAGQQFRAGQSVDLWLAAANHDPRVFANPGAFDMHRVGNRHLAFGFGAHFCLGAPLARLEGRLALASLMRRFPKIVIDPIVTEMTYHPGSVFRALTSLPVTVSRR